MEDLQLKGSIMELNGFVLTISTFKDRPILEIRSKEKANEKYALVSFGQGKATAIAACIEAIAKFAKEGKIDA
jgi:hypothetical protein